VAITAYYGQLAKLDDKEWRMAFLGINYF
jgi:hypothetical protein